MTSLDLFGNLGSEPLRSNISEQATLFHQFLAKSDDALLTDVRGVLKSAPLRHLQTPAGHKMSVKSSNCGEYGWLSDSQGYRYQKIDPVTKAP